MTDLPKIPRTYPSNSSHPLENHGSHPQQSTSLPSFASLSEHASRTDDPDEVEIAPMSARLPCSSCNKLTPLIREVALAVAELDDNVQQYCNKSATRVWFSNSIQFAHNNSLCMIRRLTFQRTTLSEQLNGYWRGW